MANKNLIREFLVGLGYKVDESGQRRFVDGVENVTDVVNKLSATLKAVATGAALYGVVHWFDKVTGGLEDMYYAAQRTHSSVRELQSFGYAASQMGSSAAQALSSAQAIYQFIRNQPNAPDWLRSQLGVNIIGPDGQMKSGVEIAKEIGAALNRQPIYLQAQYADQLGIPLELRQAMQRAAAFDQFQRQYDSMLRKAGLNPDQAALQARDFQRGARSIGAAFEIVRNSVMSALTGHGGASGALGRFRDMILSHVPQITRILSRLADAGVTAFGKFLDWLDHVDWNKVFDKIGAFFDWLLGLDPQKVVGYLKDIAAVLAVIVGLKMLAGVATFAATLARLVPLFGGIASGFSGVAAAAGATGAALATVVAALAAAAAGGFIGHEIHKHLIAGTKADDVIGDVVASFLAAFGSKEAQQAINDADHVGPENHSGDFHGLPGKFGNGDKSTRGLRNNNPGNLIYDEFTRKLGATGADANGFAIFPTARAGLNAIAANLASYARKGVNTPFAIAHRWSTTDQDAYTAALAKALGVGVNDAVNLSDPAVINALRNSIILQENGRNPYASEATRRDPLASAAGATQHLKAETHITVNGASNPIATGRAVASEQDGVNQRMVRNFRQVFA